VDAGDKDEGGGVNVPLPSLLPRQCCLSMGAAFGIAPPLSDWLTPVSRIKQCRGKALPAPRVFNLTFLIFLPTISASVCHSLLVPGGSVQWVHTPTQPAPVNALLLELSSINPKLRIGDLITELRLSAHAHR
jgi:hypothetical protein